MSFVTAQDLRDRGLPMHRHILQSNYDWPGGPPFDIQKHTVAHLTENAKAYVLSDMGTGKTRCALWAFDWLKREGVARKMLVVCPISGMQFTWAREIFQVTPHLTYQVLWHTKREKRLERLDMEADIYIINHDGLKLLQKELIARRDLDVFCIDELAT